VNGVGAAGLATVVGSAKLGDSVLGGDANAKGKNGFCAGWAETAAGNGGGPFEATGAVSTAIVGNGGGSRRTGATAGTATDGASTGAATAAAAGDAGTDTTAAAVGAGEGRKATGLGGLGR
jgi:hypothetical protein